MCRHFGLDCPFEATGTTNSELMRKFVHHAEPAHKIEVLSAEEILKFQKVIKK